MLFSIASFACLLVAIVALTRFLPAQNVSFIVVSLAAVEVALEYRLQSGNFMACAMFWPGLIILSRLAAQRLLRPWRRAHNYGLFLLGVASGEAALAQTFRGPVTPAMIAGRFCVTAASLLFLTPWFLQKRTMACEIFYREGHEGHER
jgi:hypothetical protein